MSVEVDRVGLQYSMLLAIQENHLLIWQEKIPPALHTQIAAYVRKHNRQAPDNTEKHSVYRGQDLVQIILSWPRVEPAYPSVNDTGEDVI